MGRSFLFFNPYMNRGELHLKGSIHNHTDNSELIDTYGSGKPYLLASKLKDICKFDFYTFTDHNFITTDPGVDGIIWLGNSFEDTRFGSDQQHLCVYNLPEKYSYYEFPGSIQEVVDHYLSLGAVVSYAHPDWEQQFQPNDKVSSVANVLFVEVLNSGQSGSERAYALMQQKYSNVFCVGVDDYHYSESWDDPDKFFNKAYIYVYSKERTKESILDALMSGCFYASSGAVMDIRCSGSLLNIKTNKISKIELVTPDDNTEDKYRIVETYTDYDNLVYQIDGSIPIFWFKITNNDGIAISQAFKIYKN